jgi:hypothetical protein
LTGYAERFQESFVLSGTLLGVNFGKAHLTRAQIAAADASTCCSTMSSTSPLNSPSFTRHSKGDVTLFGKVGVFRRRHFR